jgi:parallel beta-helix repeat protein
MNKKIFVATLVLFLFLAALGMDNLAVDAQTSNEIIISGNGITPFNAPIQRIGSIYTLTKDTDQPISILTGNIILDGAGHTLQGTGSGYAINIIASNVIVMNLQIDNWKTGILGTYNNNTIANCTLTRNGFGIALYADDYVIFQNQISEGSDAIYIKGTSRPEGDNNLIIQNEIFSNNFAFHLRECDGIVITQNNVYDNNYVLFWATFGTFTEAVVFSNNFTDNTQVFTIPGPILDPTAISEAGKWNKGALGNFWSDYQDKYPNATEIDQSGIGDTWYIASNNYTIRRGINDSQIETVTLMVVDHYPFINPVIANSLALNLTLSSPTTSPLPSPSPTLSASPKFTASLSESASAINFGDRINFTVTVNGGKAPYTYDWYFDNQLVERTNSPHYSTETSTIGSHHVFVQVTDADINTNITLTAEFNVLPTPSNSPSIPASSSPTQQPTSEPNQSVSPEPNSKTINPYIILIPIIVVVIIAASAFVYFKRRKNNL